MKTTYRISTLVAAAAVVLAVVSAGCGGSGSSAVTPASRSYLGTQAPGDVWTWNISNGTFTATDVTKSYTYSGTESVLPTGFLKLTMQATTDPGVTVGSSAYAIELPNTALILQPAGANTSAPITACALGSNPPGPTVTYDFVTVPSTTWNNTKTAAGYITFAVSGNNYTGTKNNFDINANPLTAGTLNLTCVGGNLTGTGSSGQVYDGAVTPSGVCVIDFGPNNGGMIGVKQPAADVSLSALGNMTLHGFMIKQGVTEEVECTPNGNGTLSGQGYADVETGTFEGGESGVTVSFTSQIAPGLVEMSVATSGGQETILCCVSTVAGKTMILGFGDASGSPAYNVMMVQE